MKLTSDYRRVTGLFNTPQEQEIGLVEHRDFGFTSARFQVGPFNYLVRFLSKDKGPFVVFQLDSIDVKTDGELVQLMSKIVGKNVSLEEAEEMRTRMLNENQSTLGIGGSMGIKVFGNVMAIAKSYVQKYRPQCFTLAGEPRRRSLYLDLLRRAFPQAKIEANPGGSLTAYFSVCFGGDHG